MGGVAMLAAVIGALWLRKSRHRRSGGEKEDMASSIDANSMTNLRSGRAAEVYGSHEVYGDWQPVEIDSRHLYEMHHADGVLEIGARSVSDKEGIMHYSEQQMAAKIAAEKRARRAGGFVKTMYELP